MNDRERSFWKTPLLPSRTFLSFYLSLSSFVCLWALPLFIISFFCLPFPFSFLFLTFLSFSFSNSRILFFFIIYSTQKLLEPAQKNTHLSPTFSLLSFPAIVSGSVFLPLLDVSIGYQVILFDFNSFLL